MDGSPAWMFDWAHAPRMQDASASAAGHALDDHLRSVGSLAASFAASSSAPLALAAGYWHDLGKRRIGFQRYIRSVGGGEAHIERVADRDKTHSAAGAIWAAQYLHERFGQSGLLASRALQYVIAGHHAGLDDWHGALLGRLEHNDSLREFSEAMARAPSTDLLRPDLEAPDLRAFPITNEHQTGQCGRFALWVRMVFSAVVDADFLDTEAYLDGAKADRRQGAPSISQLQHMLHQYLEGIGGAQTPVNEARARVLAQCRRKARFQSGVFTLTVPTGGGKTLASLAFALDHAAAYGKQRVIVAIPYTSIIEQTADAYRRVFASLGDDVVVEHHSNAEADPERETARSRLACENWDAPLIVTTNVQLFESLFARRTSRCRKLHNLANSVIVLDEAQLLPVEFLQPVVDVLRYLVQDYGVTLVLCTATQPALNTQPRHDMQRGLRRGLPAATEIVDDVPALYRALERVAVHMPASLETPTSWEQLANSIASHDAVLAIVSRRADAAELFRLVRIRDRRAPCWHLSALMCAQHRSDVIADIKAALEARRQALAAGRPALPVRVLSTQLVEAGVDLDFPVVYRALAGLDSIAQAAGRCNREGLLPTKGDVHVFVPPTQAPRGILQLARETCKQVLYDKPSDPLALDRIERYFRALYFDAPTTDAHDICGKLKLEPDGESMSLPVKFRSASDAFKLICDEDQATVLVRYRSPRGNENVDALIGLLEREGPSRWLLRKLQRFGVSLRWHQIQILLGRGEVSEVATCPGLYVQLEGWEGLYDPDIGLRVDSGLTASPSLVV